MKHLLILILLAAVTLSAAPNPPTPTTPPVFDETFKGASITVLVLQPYATTYQWYRGTATAPKKVKIEGATRAELILEPPYVAGEYRCEATNVIGSTLSKPVRVSVTGKSSAPEMQITLKQP